MKLLLVLAALALGLWLWRSGRSRNQPGAAARPQAPAPAQEMIACAWCQVHVPQAEALPGSRGQYCCAQHRQQAEP